MKKLSLVLSVFMLVAMSAGLVMAAEKHAAKHVATLESLEGQVVSIDTHAGKIVIMANNKEETLEADANLIKDIVVGEKVSIEKTGNILKSIKKFEIVPVPVQ
ncbi:MAG: hypothetical protein KJ737_15635 [Proteobacteria bacterium]|nr:hypothetical protein [Pseudomonadota bacterium]